MFVIPLMIKLLIILSDSDQASKVLCELRIFFKYSDYPKSIFFKSKDIEGIGVPFTKMKITKNDCSLDNKYYAIKRTKSCKK